MAGTLVNLLVHVVFATRFRRHLITPDIEPELHRYMAGIARQMGSPCVAINGMSDHIHMLLSLSKNQSLSVVVGQIKRGSSRWIKLRGEQWRDFRWQGGYGAFAVSESGRNTVIRYIARQKEHHARRTFTSEYTGLVERHNVDYDPRYLFD